MLRDGPHLPLTMQRAAEAVGASPMTLYRYFGDRDGLALAVTQHVMRSARDEVPEDAPWQERVRGWMTTVFEQSLRYPQLVELAASYESHAWIGESARLTRILQAAGFSDERQLAEAVYWVSSTTLGQAIIATRAQGASSQLPNVQAALGHLDPDDAAIMTPLLPHLMRDGLTGFGQVVDLTIVALSVLTGDVGPDEHAAVREAPMVGQRRARRSERGG
jgi:TetR/AcrR family transcriptional regulator, tetracycline repressor protein